MLETNPFPAFTQGHCRKLKFQYKIFFHTSCNDKIASTINCVTYKMLSLAGLLGTKVSPPLKAHLYTQS